MRRTLLLIVLAALAAAGCASPQSRFEDLRSGDQEARIEAALDLGKGVKHGDDDYVAARAEIAVELRRLLDDKSALVRQVAIECLADVDGKAAAGPITDRLRDRDPWVRYIAARHLGYLGATSAVEALADRLKSDESVNVRRQAAQSLAMIGSRAALHNLYLALQDVPDVRYQAYLALRQITGQDPGEDPNAWRPLIGGE
jgi:HEAT repeat protein